MNLTPENQSSSEPDPEFVALVQRILDHEASLEDLALLNTILPADPAALRYFVKMRRLHVALEDEFGNSSNKLDSIEGRVAPAKSGPSAVVSTNGIRPRSASENLLPMNGRTKRTGRRWAVAAILVLSSFLAYWGGQRLLERAEALEVVAQYGTGANGILSSGTWLREGERLRLEQGVVEIRSADGNLFTFEGPGELVIGDPHSLTLGSGKLWTVIQGDPVRIRTPQGELTDLGTTFGIDRSLPDATRLDVFDGRVRLTDSDDSSRQVEAAAGRHLIRKGSQWPPDPGEADLSRYTAGLRRPVGVVFVGDDAEASRVTSTLPFGAQWTPVRTPAGTVRPKGASFKVTWEGASLTRGGSHESVEAALFHTRLQTKSDEFTVWQLMDAQEHLDRATGWTWETRFRIDSANDPDRGVWEIFLRDFQHELSATRLHFLATGLDRDAAGAGVGAEVAADLTDGFHVVRAAIEGRTNLTTVWLDGVKVIDALPSAKFEAGELGLIGRWGSRTAGGSVTLDDLRFDTTGAYAPPSDPGTWKVRRSADFSSTIDPITGDVDPATLPSFGLHPAFNPPATVINGDGTLTMTLPAGGSKVDEKAKENLSGSGPAGITLRLSGMSAWLQEIGARSYRVSLLRSSEIEGGEFAPVSAFAGRPSHDSYLTMLEVWDKDRLAATFPDGVGGQGARAMNAFKAPFTEDDLSLTLPPPSEVNECNNVSALIVTPVF